MRTQPRSPRHRAALMAVGAIAFAAPLAALATFAGCSSDPPKNTPPPLVLRDDDAAKPDASPPDPPDVALPPPPDTGAPRGTIYVQTGTSLQVYEPYSKSLRDLGKFNCLPEGDLMFDIAVDRDSNIYGVTRLDRFVKIDPNNGTCSLVRQGAGNDYPVLIAFVPKGTLDPANDALVGYEGENYLRIDVRTGALTRLGTLNPPDAGNPYEASGDLIYAGANGMFLTATYPDAGDGGDSFVRFDPKNGRRLSIVGKTGYGDLLGLGYWGGSIFAFTYTGEILQMNPVTAGASLIKRVDGGPSWEAGDPIFFGASSTTVAPDSPRP